MSQEDIATFLSITNAESPDVARQFLEMSGSNLETAIALFFEHGASAATNTHSSNNDTPYIPPEEDNYRAPDQAVHETLMDTHTAYIPGVVYGGYGGSFGPLRSTSHPRGVFNQDEDYDVNTYHVRHDEDEHDIQTLDSDSDEELEFDNSDEEDQYTDEDYVEIDEDGELVERTRRVKRNNNNTGRNQQFKKMPSHQDKLAQLFRPPFDMIEKLSLDEAKLQARSSKKWIMVNIQAVEVFQCQTLNRDVWKDPKVKRLIKPNFVFLQYALDSVPGQAYVNFYSLTKPGTDSLPHIAILDPLTGERLKQWNERPPKVESFIEEVNEFLSAFSLDPTHTNPIIPTEPAPQKPVEELSEEQQLEYAIAHSMETGSFTAGGGQDSNMKGDHTQAKQEDPTEEPEVLDEFDLIEPVSVPEPANIPGSTTRIQFRLGDGSRVVRRFRVDDHVRVIYQYIKADLAGFQDSRFSIATPQRENLIDKLDESIGDAGLKNSSLLLEKEE